MKSKTSYYVCPNYFIHKKRAQLNTMLFFYSHLTETISQKYSSYINREPSKLTYAPQLTSSLRRGDSIFYPIFPLKIRSTPFFPCSREEFHSLNCLFGDIKNFYGILVTLLACLLLKDILLIQASKFFSFSIRLPEVQFTLAMSLPFKQQ